MGRAHSDAGACHGCAGLSAYTEHRAVMLAKADAQDGWGRVCCPVPATVRIHQVMKRGVPRFVTIPNTPALDAEYAGYEKAQNRRKFNG